jgi:hypothetical protein
MSSEHTEAIYDAEATQAIAAAGLSRPASELAEQGFVAVARPPVEYAVKAIRRSAEDSVKAARAADVEAGVAAAAAASAADEATRAAHAAQETLRAIRRLEVPQAIVDAVNQAAMEAARAVAPEAARSAAAEAARKAAEQAVAEFIR